MTRFIAVALAVLTSCMPAFAQSASSWTTGTWTGKWGGVNPGEQPVLPSNLVIDEVNGEIAKGKLVMLEDAPQYGAKKGTYPFSKGRVTDRTITVGGTGAAPDGKVYKFAYTYEPDGTILAERWVDGVKNGRAVMTRVP